MVTRVVFAGSRLHPATGGKRGMTDIHSVKVGQRHPDASDHTTHFTGLCTGCSQGHLTSLEEGRLSETSKKLQIALLPLIHDFSFSLGNGKPKSLPSPV